MAMELGLLDIVLEVPLLELTLAQDNCQASVVVVVAVNIAVDTELAVQS